MPLNLGITFGATWLAFTALPPLAQRKTEDKQLLLPTEQKIRFLHMMLSVTPVVLFFLIIDGDHLLSVLYFGLFSIQLAEEDGSSTLTLTQKLAANLVAVTASIITYESIVIAPTIVMMGLVTLLLCLLYGWWLS